MRLAQLFLLGVAISMCSASSAIARDAFEPDDRTIILLRPGPDGSMTDAKGDFGAEEITIKGAATVDDARFGRALEAEDEEGMNLVVKDGGKMDFSQGFTFEMWLRLPEPRPSKGETRLGGYLLYKPGSFIFDLKDDMFNCSWMVFPSVPVVTTTDKQYKTYPIRSTSTFNRTALPTDQWTRIAATYDPILMATRIWVDGKLMATRYISAAGRGLPIDGPVPLEVNPQSNFNIFRGLKRARVGEIRISKGARPLGDAPPFETYVHALPYRGQTAVIFDHVAPSAVPLEVSLSSGGQTIQRLTLKEAKRRDFVFKPPVSEGQYPLTIKATSGGEEVYSRDVDVYAGDDTKDATHIDDQNRLIVNGEPLFPLIIYHSFIEDVPKLAKMGFNIVTPRYPNSALMSLPTRTDETIAIAKQFLDEARDNGVYMTLGGGIFAAGGGSTEINHKGIEALDKHPALAFWYGADEPGRARLRQLQEGYTVVKQLNSRPIFIVSNIDYNYPYCPEASDIFSVDPYPIPNISLRSVAVTTEEAMRATAGLKPVYTIIPQYGPKRPTEQELRCMAYLAIIAGAQGLGVYAWDDRHAITKEGWYTGDHPEDVKILETVIGELAEVKDVLIIPNSQRALTFEPQNPALWAALKEDDRGTWLMIANDSRAAEEATLSLEGLPSAEGVDVHDPTAKITIRDGKAHVKLPPLGAGMYRLSIKP